MLEEAAPRGSRAAYWRRQARAWEGSGQTQEAFCAARSLSTHAFRQARYKLNRRLRALRTASREEAPDASGVIHAGTDEAAGRFIPVTLVDREAGHGRFASAGASDAPTREDAAFLEVVLPDGLCVRASSRIDAATLTRMVRALEDRASC